MGENCDFLRWWHGGEFKVTVVARWWSLKSRWWHGGGVSFQIFHGGGTVVDFNFFDGGGGLGNPHHRADL